MKECRRKEGRRQRNKEGGKGDREGEMKGGLMSTVSVWTCD